METSSVPEVRTNIETASENPSVQVADMIQQATAQTQQYNNEAENNDNLGFTGGDWAIC